MGIRILLADDHQILREGLRALIDRQEGMQVVAEAQNGRDAVGLAMELKPDVAVVDVMMPELNGVEATRQICAALPHTRVIALSMHSGRKFIADMLQADAEIQHLVGGIGEDCVDGFPGGLIGERGRVHGRTL